MAVGAIAARAKLGTVALSALSYVYTYWSAARYNPGTHGQYLKDLGPPRVHHMRLGATGRTEVIGGALVLPGTNGNYASITTPGALTSATAGDFRILLYPDTLAGRPFAVYDGSAAGAWVFVLVATGAITFNHSDGTAISSDTSTPILSAGQLIWLRITYEVGSFAGGNNTRTRYYTAPGNIAEPAVGDWTLGSEVLANRANPNLNTAATIACGVGADSLGNNAFAGQIKRAVVKSSVDGTTTLDVDFTNLRDGTPSFLDATGKRVTVQPTRGVVVGGVYYAPGASGQYLACADHPDFDPTGKDVEVVLRVRPDTLGSYHLAGQFDGSSQRSWTYSMSGTTLTVKTSATGTGNAYNNTLSSASGVVADVYQWLKLTFERNVAGQARVSAYRVADQDTEPTSWGAAVGQITSQAAHDLFNSAAPLVFGADNVTAGFSAGSGWLAGGIKRAIVRLGPSLAALDTVFDFDASQWADGEGTNPPRPESTGKFVRVFTSTSGVDASDPTFGPFMGRKCLWRDMTASNRASVPDEAGLDITGDMTLIFEGEADSWNPATVMTVIGKWIGGVGNGSSYRLSLTSSGIQVQITPDNGVTLYTFTSSGMLPAAPGQRFAIKAEYDIDNGALGKAVTFSYSYDMQTWHLMNVRTLAGVGLPTFVGSLPVAMGSQSNTVGSDPYSGRINRVVIQDGIGVAAVTVLDVDFDDATSPYASFVCSTGQTVTISRPTSGKRAAVIDEPQFLFGADDYTETPDHPNLDITAADSMSLAVLLREWMTGNAVYASKKNAIGDNLDAGYTLYRTAASVAAFRVSDGALGNVSTSPDTGDGVQTLVSGVRDVTADQITAYADGVTLASVTDTTTTSPANTLPMRLGRAAGASTLYADMALSAAAFARQAFSTSQLASLKTELQAFAASPDRYVNLRGESGNYLVVPDSVPLRLTTSLELRLAFLPAVWPLAGTQVLVCKGADYGGRLHATGAVEAFWTDAGGTARSLTTVELLPAPTAGAVLAVRIVLGDSAGDTVLNVYYRETTDANAYADTISDAGWTLLDADQALVGAGTPFRQTNAAVRIGSLDGYTQMLAGRFYAAMIENNGTGEDVLAVDASRCYQQRGWFVAETGQVVGVNNAIGLVA